MAVLCRAYTAETEALAAVEALLAAGIPGEGIQVLMGEPARDGRDAPAGGFAGTGGPIGRFAGPARRGAAAAGAFAGTAEDQRRGSFADVDREVVASYPAGVARRHVAGHRRLRRLLVDAGLEPAVADRDVAALHEGRVLVLADVGDRPAAEAAAAFGD